MLHTRFLRRGLLAVMLAASVPAALAASAIPASASISPPTQLPLPPGVTCEPVEVTKVKLSQNEFGPVIIVLGVTTRANARLSLDAEDIDFVKQPDYFPYVVNACGTGPTIKQPFQAVFDVPTFPVGRLGISINETFLVDLFPGAPAAF